MTEVVEKITEQLGIPYTQTCFSSPPKLPYAVYLKSTESVGGDCVNLAKHIDANIELYAAKPDKALETKIEGLLDAVGLSYITTDWDYISGEKMYYITYSFDYYEK